MIISHFHFFDYPLALILIKCMIGLKITHIANIVINNIKIDNKKGIQSIFSNGLERLGPLL
jgi:hypothetical protein